MKFLNVGLTLGMYHIVTNNGRRPLNAGGIMKSFVYRNWIIDADNLGRMYAHFIPSLMSAEEDHLLLPGWIKKTEIKACIDKAIATFESGLHWNVYEALKNAIWDSESEKYNYPPANGRFDNSWL